MISFRRINRYGLARPVIFVVFHVETKFETQQNPFSRTREWRTVREKWVNYCKKLRTRFRLTANHRAHARSPSQEPESRRLKLNTYSAYDIEAYEPWDDLATIHFPDEQIATQYLVLFYHSQLYDSVHETLNLVKQFGLHTSR